MTSIFSFSAQLVWLFPNPVRMAGFFSGTFFVYVLLPISVLVLLYLLRRWFLLRIEKEVQRRLDKALRIKEKALRMRLGYDAEVLVKKGEQTKVRSLKYKSVTVLFADIQGFTRIVEQLNPELLIDELDHFFFRFDSIVEQHGIEKIKTIGDAYMAAGGIPDKSRVHSVRMILVAMEIHAYMFALRAQKIAQHQDFWELRIGIHTGPVIAGRVGRNKTALDIWGDTVNIASRMESSGVAGEINITGATYQLVKSFFVCEYRGKMPIKYKGEMDMYFVRGILPELSVEGLGQEPNELFRIRLQHIRFADLEEAVLERLEEELPADICYHSVKHTIDVVTQVEIIAQGEGVDEEELLLLKTAALLHDAGFIVDYRNHEESSMQLAREVLATYDYSAAQIEKVVALIAVTRPEAEPENLLECIMKDADLDYLGRSDFLNVSDTLYQELQRYKGQMTPEEWLEKQYGFLSTHRYYTTTARKMRQVNKEKQLAELQRLMQNAT